MTRKIKGDLDPKVLEYHADEPYEKYPDNCGRCAGTSGGVRGNENIYNNRHLCDYCSVDIDRGEPVNIPCRVCGVMLYAHKLMNRETAELCWANGIYLKVCHGGGAKVETGAWDDHLILVTTDHDIPERPDNPCDEDYVEEISS